MNWYKAIISSKNRISIINRFEKAWLLSDRPHSPRIYIKEWTIDPIDKNENDIIYFSPDCVNVPSINLLIAELNCVESTEPNIENLYCPFEAG